MRTYFSESALTVFGKSSILDNTPVRFSEFPKLSKSALWHGYSSVNVLHIFRRPFPKNTSRWLLLTGLGYRASL